MTIRTGTPYQVSQDQPITSMDSNLENLMRSMTEQLRQLSTRVDQRFEQMNGRISSLEESYASQLDPTPIGVTSRHDLGSQYQKLTPDPIPRYQTQHRDVRPDQIPRHQI